MGPDYAENLARARRWVDSQELVGLEIADLRTLAGDNGLGVRVVAGAGETMMLTADRRANRLNVEVVEGVVVRLDGVY